MVVKQVKTIETCAHLIQVTDKNEAVSFEKLTELYEELDGK